MADKTKVVVYGAGGYGGVGLVENLLTHPRVEISALVSREGAGAPYTDMYPHLKGLVNHKVEAAETFDPKGRGQFVFFSTPDGVGQSIIRQYLQAGYKIIDFSGDYRFNDSTAYKNYSAWQQGEQDHSTPDLLAEAVYGCPELYRDRLRGARIVGNPGCMAISCILAMAPALKNGLIKPGTMIFDSKTGISGAGKKLKAQFHFPSAYGNAYAYKVGRHQHVFEMEREFTTLAGKAVQVDFTPHVIPISRGILSTCYARMNSDLTTKDVVEAYQKFYSREPFVEVEASSRVVSLTEVVGGNKCKITVQVNPRTNSLIAVSLIDNLQKGQAGNAIQNMNIMLGYDETFGLQNISRVP